MLLGCIGDDFTGSSDLGNTLTRGGMRCVQYVGVPDAPAGPEVEAGIVALKSRSIPVDDAVRLSLAALDWLRAQGCRQFLFKYCSTFDSTPEGNIGPVAEALADALDARKVLVCPAFPATGRSVYQGHLFVGDHLLSESGMESHPLTPMTDPDLRRWLARQVSGSVGHVAAATVLEGVDAVRARLSDRGCRRPLPHRRRRHPGRGSRHAGACRRGAAPRHRRVRHRPRPADGPSRGGSAGRRRRPVGRPGRPCCGAVGLLLASDAGAGGAARRGASGPRGIARRRHGRRRRRKSLADWAIGQRGMPLIYTSADPDAVRAAQNRHGREAVAGAIEALSLPRRARW